jgi:hypothetical protein
MDSGIVTTNGRPVLPSRVYHVRATAQVGTSKITETFHGWGVYNENKMDPEMIDIIKYSGGVVSVHLENVKFLRQERSVV